MTTRTAILATSDGAATWSPGRIQGLRANVLAMVGFRAQLACSGPTGWALFTGEGGISQQAYLGLRTTDAGATWSPVLQHLPGGDIPSLGGLPPIDAYTGPIAAPSRWAAYFLGECDSCGEGGMVSVTWTSGEGTSRSKATLVNGHGCCSVVPVAVSFSNADHGWALVEHDRMNRRATRWFLLATSDGSGLDQALHVLRLTTQTRQGGIWKTLRSNDNADP